MKRRRPGGPAARLAWISVAIIAALVIVACSSDAARPASAPTPLTATSAPVSGGVGGVTGEAGIPAIVRKVQPSVVTILTKRGLGSGIVYRSDGTVVTDDHVVSGNSSVTVAFADGRQVSGTVKAGDPVTDIAVVQANRKGLPAATFQRSLPEVGALDVVIGSPLGFQETVTAGIISGLHRQIPGSAAQGQQSLIDLVQTDAPISPGNSGGAVVDVQAGVVGMSEAYIPPEQGAVSIGFAIPAATVVDIADQLLATGRARHAYLGIQPVAITAQVAQQLGLRSTNGVLVLDVVGGGPAAKAGMRPGDVITAVNGKATDTAEDFLASLRVANPGDRIALTLQRGGRSQDVQVTVADRPGA